MSCSDDCPVANPGFSSESASTESAESFDVRMPEMAGVAEPKGKKTRKESKWGGSQSKFPHIFIKLQR